MTDDERAHLTALAGRVPLGVYIRNRVLGGEVHTIRRRTVSPVKDHTALARVLAALGQSRLSNNLNQLAKAANIGVLPMTPETEAELLDACRSVVAIRYDLVEALGLEGGSPP